RRRRPPGGPAPAPLGRPEAGRSVDGRRERPSPLSGLCDPLRWPVGRLRAPSVPAGLGLGARVCVLPDVPDPAFERAGAAGGFDAVFLAAGAGLAVSGAFPYTALTLLAT
ncbi:MAG: hypothetical protein WD535_02640, partial [Thermaerobacterales bacterium]